MSIAALVCVIIAAGLVPIALLNPRLRNANRHGRRAEFFLWASIAALAVALLLRHLK
jgi:hypothetical protein